MWELDYKETWAPKNWCVWTVVLEKTLESPLDCKEIQPVHPKGNQSWVFIGRTDAEPEAPLLWPPDVKNSCKTQNSGLRSKEEKPRDPINQPSRCNTQEGLLTVVQTGWLWSPGRQSTPNSKLGKLFICKKKTILSAYYIRVTKWLVTCLQSNPIGTNGTGFGSNLGARGLFSSPAGFYWVHIDWLAPGHPMGAGNPTISRETETQVPAACQPQPQPRQPHIKLISQLQKPTRKISDTWIIDTDKRETRYQLVKVHQTIRQPHN